MKENNNVESFSLFLLIAILAFVICIGVAMNSANVKIDRIGKKLDRIERSLGG